MILNKRLFPELTIFSFNFFLAITVDEIMSNMQINIELG